MPRPSGVLRGVVRAYWPGGRPRRRGVFCAGAGAGWGALGAAVLGRAPMAGAALVPRPPMMEVVDVGGLGCIAPICGTVVARGCTVAGAGEMGRA